MRVRTVQRLFVLAGALSSTGALVHAQQPADPPATFVVKRVAAGPRGSEAGGEFRLDQERTTFSRSSDTQVVVHFVWEGVPGPHRLGARWRSPTGGLAISEVEYTARDRRFGAYWTLPISPSMPLGTWVIEATIDGLPAGGLSFEIADGDVPPDTSKPRPSPPELFRRLDAAYVTVDRLTARGDLIDQNAGFVIGPSRVATAFTAVDSADTLRIAAADGRQQAVAAIVSWDRRRDWATLPATDLAGPPLPAAPADSVAVGDRCYSLEGGADGGRMLTECAIVGRSGTGAAGDRLLLQFQNGRGIPGAPVLNEFGEVIGLIGGTAAIGLRGITVLRAGLDQGPTLVPISAVRSGTGEAVAFPDLQRRGVLMRAVVGRHHVQSAGFARRIQQYPVRPIDQREEFTSADDKLCVFVAWDPKERLRGALVLRTYDENNQIVTESKPSKVDLKPERVPFSQWQMPVPGRPGEYRVDVLLEGVPIWRSVFRVTS